MLDTVYNNPLIAGAAGVTVIAGGCISLGNALLLTLLMLLLLPLVGMIAAVDRERVSSSLRPAMYCAITAVTVFLFSLLANAVSDGSFENLGIFGPLVAVDSLVLAATNEDAPYVSVREAVWSSVGCAAVFAVIAFPVAFVREMFGNGTLFGGWLGFDGFDALKDPFAGFILCALALAGFRAVLDRISEKPAADNRRMGGGRR